MKYGYQYIYKLIANGVLPITTPFKCECGSYLIVNENLTRIECSNNGCFIHNSQKFLDMLDILGIKAGIGEKNSELIINALDIKQPIDIFKKDLHNIDIPTSLYSPITNLRNEIDKIKNDGIEFYKFINILFLEDLGKTRSKVILSEFSNPEDFYGSFDNRENMSDYVANKLEIGRYTQTVENIVGELLGNMKDILEYSKYLKFKKSNGEPYYITITGDILHVKDDNGNIFKNRKLYPEYLSKKFGRNIQEVGFSESKTNVLIMDSDMTSNRKYKKAISVGIPIMTSKEFYELLEGENKGLKWGN